jgi:hypothetical protein
MLERLGAGWERPSEPPLPERRERVGRAELAWLPGRLKFDAQTPVRTLMLVRLGAARTFARGQKAGVLKTTTGGSDWRKLPGLNLRQRVIVKAHVSKHAGARPGSTLAVQVAYLGRSGTAENGREAGVFFGAEAEGLDAGALTRAWADDRHHFRFIISPEHGDRLADLQDYTRDLMRRVTADLKEPGLEWIAVNHYDTDQPHSHVLIRGRRADGRDLVIPGRYIGYGFRSRAQEVAQERLGELTREEAECSVWRDVTADRATALDRALVKLSVDGLTPYAGELSRTDAYGAVLRGRLAHLEALGMAERVRGGARLDADLIGRLNRLGMERDVIRTLHQRMFHTQTTVRELGGEPAAGRVVASGWLDELHSAAFVVVSGAGSDEVFASIGAVQPPKLGVHVRLEPRGVRQARAVDLSRLDHLDVESERLLTADRELMHRARERAAGRMTPLFDAAAEQALAERGRVLVARGLAQAHPDGVAITRDGYLALRDADIRLAIKEQLGREAALLVHGLRSDGRKIGVIHTASGAYDVQSRTIGYAVGRQGERALSRGAELGL